ncbi:MAG TPA: FAD/NAD(P)-binding protein [Anaerolineae bacterium]
MIENPYVPYLGRLAAVETLGTGIKLFKVRFDDRAVAEAFRYQPGQFGFLSAFGVGEAPFGITSVCGIDDTVDFAVAKVGTVTQALHGMNQGDVVGVRGPMGNWFPMDQIKGKNVIVLGGGIGGAPLRPVITSILHDRASYGDLTILWAARNPRLLVFTEEYETWHQAPNTALHLTVDEGDAGWTGHTGLITQLLQKVGPNPDNATVIICGPPIMIHFAIIELQKMGFASEQIITTLEAKMKCGIGKCGRCNMGEKYVCLHGPVFSHAEIKGFLESFL